jgi:proteasome assembly chaperone (PAC2) family protein
MIAGWPGMGSVALGVVDYLRRKLGATKFAEIRLDPLATIDSVMVEDGVAVIPPARRQYSTARRGKAASPLMRVNRSSLAAATISPSRTSAAALSW